MRIRSCVAWIVAVAVVAAPATPAWARHRKPIEKTYKVTLPVPMPNDGDSHCAPGTEGVSKHTESFRAPERGALAVALSGFYGDWVIEIFDGKGEVVAAGASLNPTDTAPVREAYYGKARPGETLRIVACNWAGTPQAQVRYTFTFAK